jgi:hypothetical protein
MKAGVYPVVRHRIPGAGDLATARDRQTDSAPKSFKPIWVAPAGA